MAYVLRPSDSCLHCYVPEYLTETSLAPDFRGIAVQHSREDKVTHHSRRRWEHAAEGGIQTMVDQEVEGAESKRS